MNKFVYRTIAAVCMLAAASGCSRAHSDAPTDSRRTVMVVRPQRGDIVSSITLPGDLVGLYQSTLYAKVTGYLKTISVDKGDWVKEGQVLAVIEVPELQERLARAAAGGLAVSTVLTLFLVPALYEIFYSRRQQVSK